MLVSLVIAVLGQSIVMSGAWLFQRRLGDAGWVDIFWTAGVGCVGAAAAVLGYGDPRVSEARTGFVAALSLLWALRLATHLAIRVAKANQEDARYAELRQRWGQSFPARMFLFLQVQALASAPLLLAILAAARNPAPFPQVGDWLGGILLLVAIVGERAADRQLSAFKADARNRGRICDTGLWSWSRHPNYFFEWLAWCAYPLVALDLRGGYLEGWLSLLAPLAMYWLLVRVSGIPPLEAHMLRSRGDAFRAYMRRTSAFFPRPPIASLKDVAE